MKTSRQTILNSLKDQYPNDGKSNSRTVRMISGFLDQCENLRDLKSLLDHYANKYNCIFKQIDNDEQWYLGEKFHFNRNYIYDIFFTIGYIAEHTFYKIEEKSGFYYIESIPYK